MEPRISRLCGTVHRLAVAWIYLGRVRLIIAQTARVASPWRSAFVLRTCLAEDELHRAVDAGARQYVLLGAGLDTFGLRQPAWAQSLRVIEVDHPASQEFKRDRVASAGLEIPRNL